LRKESPTDSGKKVAAQRAHLRSKCTEAKKPSSKLVHAIPDEDLESLARCQLPAMRSYFESVEGWREFAEWQLRNDIEELYAGSYLILLRLSHRRRGHRNDGPFVVLGFSFPAGDFQK